MIAKASHHKNPFLGIYCAANEDLALVPLDASAQLKRTLEETLQVSVHSFSLCESSLLGLFCVLNSKSAVVSPAVTSRERKALEALGLNVVFAEETLSAVGNNVLLNDRAAMLNPNASVRFAQELEEVLSLPVKKQSVAGISTIASGCVVTNKGVLAYPETTETELKLLEKTFSVQGAIGTTNLGSPFNHLSLIANSKGAVVGELTTGFEISRVHEALFA